MVIKSSGPLSFVNDIEAEFDDASPHSLSEFYGVDQVIPDGGTISFSDFYNAQDGDTFLIDGIFERINLKEFITSNGWDGTLNVTINISPNSWIWSDDVTKPALDISNIAANITINNYGKIIGRGGNGASAVNISERIIDAQPGGTAVYIAQTLPVVFNCFGDAYVAGGGGGGGSAFVQEDFYNFIVGGGGGGAGGGFGGNVSNSLQQNVLSDNDLVATDGGLVRYGELSDREREELDNVSAYVMTAGGAINSVGAVSDYNLGATPTAAGAGGAGVTIEQQLGLDSYGRPGGGGRILPGVGGIAVQGFSLVGGNGGSAGVVGASPLLLSNSIAAGGGGGWGAAGGDTIFSLGGRGGYSFELSNSSLSVNSFQNVFGIVQNV